MAAEPTTAISRRRRPRGRYPKAKDGSSPQRRKRIPEYLEADEVNAIIRTARNPKAKLLMLEQWRPGFAFRRRLIRDNDFCRPVASSEFVTEISAALIVAHRCDVT